MGEDQTEPYIPPMNQAQIDLLDATAEKEFSKAQFIDTARYALMIGTVVAVIVTFFGR